MAGHGKSRRRLIQEIQFLQEQTRPEEPISIEGLRGYLGELTATRAIIYEDLNEMEEMGFGIRHSKNGHYYYDRQSFTQGELALMIDLICCAGYPDAESAKKLILHIKQMGNLEQFDDLSRQVNLALRNKTDNPACIDNTDRIHEAIRSDRKIAFRYARTDRFGVTSPCTDRTVSPYQLVWNNSYLYLIGGALHDHTVKLRNFRVDKIYGLELLDSARAMLPPGHAFYSEHGGFDAEKYLRSTFDMFNSPDESTVSVTFCAANYLVGAAADMFGRDIALCEYDEGHMQFTAEIQVSNMFFGWLSRFTYDQMHILRPSSLIEQYQAHLREIAQGYAGQTSSKRRSI